MPKYKVPVKAVFEGFFVLEANSTAQAREFTEKHCGILLGHIHSTLDDDDVDWEFGVHPEKQIGRITKA